MGLPRDLYMQGAKRRPPEAAQHPAQPGAPGIRRSQGDVASRLAAWMRPLAMRQQGCCRFLSGRSSPGQAPAAGCGERGLQGGARWEESAAESGDGHARPAVHCLA